MNIREDDQPHLYGFANALVNILYKRQPEIKMIILSYGRKNIDLMCLRTNFIEDHHLLRRKLISKNTIINNCYK